MRRLVLDFVPTVQYVGNGVRELNAAIVMRADKVDGVDYVFELLPLDLAEARLLLTANHVDDEPFVLMGLVGDKECALAQGVRLPCKPPFDRFDHELEGEQVRTQWILVVRGEPRLVDRRMNDMASHRL